MRIYLDNCCYNRPFDNQEQLKIKIETEAKLYIQQEILNGSFDLVWSHILEYENTMNPFEMRKTTISAWRSVASICVEENEEILVFAESLLPMGIRPKDALHIASARYARSDYFITTDKKLINKSIDGIKIISPIDFINELEERL